MIFANHRNRTRSGPDYDICLSWIFIGGCCGHARLGRAEYDHDRGTGIDARTGGRALAHHRGGDATCVPTASMNWVPMATWPTEARLATGVGTGLLAMPVAADGETRAGRRYLDDSGQAGRRYRYAAPVTAPAARTPFATH